MSPVTTKKRSTKFAVLFFYAFVLLASVGLVKWQLNNSMEIWFYDDDPKLIAHKTVMNELGEWEWLIVVLETKKNIYDKQFLDELQKLGNQVASLDKVKKVISIANARGTFNDDRGLEYRFLYNSENASHESLDQELQQRLLSNPIFANSLFKEGQENTTVLLVQDAIAFDDGGPERINLINDVKAILDDAPSIANHWIVGTTILNAALNTFTLHDVFNFYPLAFAICIIFGWWVFGNWRDLAVAISIVSAVVSTTISTMVYSGFTLNMVTVMMPSILTILSMAGVTHVITHFHQLRKVRVNDSLNLISLQVVRDLWIPSLGCALTTIIGFVTLVFTGIVPIIQLGIFTAAGILFGYVLTMGIAPLLLTYFWNDKEHLYEGTHRSLTAYANQGLAVMAPKIIKNRWGIIFLSSFTAMSCMAGLMLLKADTSYLMMFNKDTEIRNSYANVEQTGFAASNLRILLDMKNGLEDPQTFLALDKLQHTLNQLPQITKVVSPIDGFKEIDRSVAKDAHWTEQNYLSYKREIFAQLLFVGELSNNDDMKDLLSPDNKIGQMFIFTNYLTNGEIRQLVDEIDHLIKIHLPSEIKASVTGLPILWANMDRQISVSQITGLLIMTVTLLTILLVITKSFSLSMIGLIVNLLPVMSIIGLMAWLDIKLNIGTTLIGGIALGLAVDDTIHFIWRYLKERRKGINIENSLIGTIKFTGLAILLTSVLTAAGFSVMMLSQFIPTADFGLLTSGALLLALLVDMFLLPAILMVSYGGTESRST